jgi:hypothetical protein
MKDLLRSCCPQPPGFSLHDHQTHQHPQWMRPNIDQRMVLQRPQNIDVLVLDLLHRFGFSRRQAIFIRHVLCAKQEAVPQLLLVPQIVEQLIELISRRRRVLIELIRA